MAETYRVILPHRVYSRLLSGGRGKVRRVTTQWLAIVNESLCSRLAEAIASGTLPTRDEVKASSFFFTLWLRDRNFGPFVAELRAVSLQAMQAVLKALGEDSVDLELRFDLRWAREWGVEAASALIEALWAGIRAKTWKLAEQPKPDVAETTRLLMDVVSAWGRSHLQTVADNSVQRFALRGVMLGLENSRKITHKRWVVTFEDTCEDCMALANMVVPLKEDFIPGVPGPTLHPHCKCVLEGVIPVAQK